MKISDPSGLGVAGFQDRIRSIYPKVVMHLEQGIIVQIDETGQQRPMLTSTPIWRFNSSDDAWNVSLSPEALSIDTPTAYQNRADFLKKLRWLLSALADEYHPSQAMRLGFRYLNVLGEGALDQLEDLVRPEFLAFAGTEFAPNLKGSNNFSEFTVPEGNLLLKWGILPAGAIHDASVMMPAPERRWYLDLDASYTVPEDFNLDQLIERSSGLTERIYSMFRWAVKPTFLEMCGAK